MTLVCVASSKGSPGGSTVALGLAAVWPEAKPAEPGAPPTKVLIEADPLGGVLALRYQVPANPGLLSLAAGAASSPTAESLWASAQPLPGGLPVVVAPDRPDQIMAALSSTGPALAQWLSESDDLTAIVDVGRLGQDPSVRALLSAADAILIVARPRADQLQSVSNLMGTLPKGPSIGWVLIGSRPYSPQEVAQAYGYPVVGLLPDDPGGAARLGEGSGGSRLRRSLLVRELGQVANGLDQALRAVVRP